MAAPEIKKGPPVPGSQLPQGAAGQLNAAMETTGANQPPPGASPTPVGGPPPQIQQRPGMWREETPLPPHVQPFQDAVFGPSNRPDEPVTAGVPFGPGANWVDTRNLSPDQELQLTAHNVLSNPRAGSRAKAFFARVLNGE